MERLVIIAALCALAVASDYSMFTAGDLLTTGAKTFRRETTIHVAALQSVDFAQHVTVELGMESQPLSALLTNGYGYFSFSTYSSVKFSLTTVIPSQSVVFFLSSWSDDAPVVYTPANMTSSTFTMLNVDSRSVVLLQPSATSQFPELLLKTVAVSGSATVTSYTKNGGADLFIVGNSDFANWDSTTVYGAVIMISTDCNNCYSTSTSSATFVATWQTNDYGSYDRIVRPQQSGIVMAPCYKSGNCTSGKQRVRLASQKPISYPYNQILKFTLQSSSVDTGRGTLTIGNKITRRC